MAASFHQLMIEEHQARAALEAAVEEFLRAETTLIAENSVLPDVTRTHARDAALELVHLLVEKKLKQLTALARAEAASASPPTVPFP